jgi:hypothetical protein
VAAGVAMTVATAMLSLNSPEAHSSLCRVAWGTYVTGGPLEAGLGPVRAVDDRLGRHSQLVHWYVPWGASWGTFDYQRPLLDNIHNYSSQGFTGAVPLITWEPWSPPFGSNGADVPLTAIAAGGFDAYIDSWAVGLRQIGYRVLIDFAHEMNGDWYPWGSGVNGNTPAQYIAAFRHVHDRFALAGAGNVRFVWNPNHVSTTSPASVFYPGDAYVDWLAIDAYNSNWDWGTPYNQIAPIYRELAALNSTKPMMLAEVASMATPPAGATPVDKAAWISALASTLPQSFPRIRAVVWFNELNTELPIDSSPEALAAAASTFGGCMRPRDAAADGL